jgi:hypothetical protein
MTSSTISSLALLRTLLQEVPTRLAHIREEKLNAKPAPDKWSAKEELGHLLDSAGNNHQRIVRAQLENAPAMPGYEQKAWVDLHGYSRRDWRELIAVWTALNRQLLAAAESVPDAAWSRTCTIADSKPLTLQFVFEDYLEHMLHHLRHIGIVVDDLTPTKEIKVR